MSGSGLAKKKTHSCDTGLISSRGLCWPCCLVIHWDCVKWRRLCEVTETVWSDGDCVKWLRLCEVTETVWSDGDCVKWLRLCEVTETVWSDGDCVKWLPQFESYICCAHICHCRHPVGSCTLSFVDAEIDSAAATWLWSWKHLFCSCSLTFGATSTVGSFEVTLSA